VLLWNTASNNTIGGSASGAGNLISGNGANGVQIFGSGTNGNAVLGNFIGTSAGGAAALPNPRNGVLIASGASNNMVGGALGNVIAFNQQNGVAVTDAGSTGNTIRANSIFSNALLGIDLGEDGVTLNHTGDVLAGPNNLQNYPVILTANPGATTTATGALNGTASTTFTLDFYASAQPNMTLYGDGQRYLGSTTVTTDASGNATFSFSLSAATSTGDWLTATATDPNGDTSEFSAAHKLPAGPLVLSTTAWTPIGPAPVASNFNAPIVAGRVEVAAADPSNPNVMYVGGNDGGVWKTTDWLDPAPVWTPLTDFQSSLNIGDKGLAVAPSNPQIVYASVGYPRGGVLKSTDGGATWTLFSISQAFFGGLGAVVVDPTNANTVYLANRDNDNTGGVWKSINGGVSWRNVTGGYHIGGVSDVVIDPTNPAILYAGFVSEPPFGSGSPTEASNGIWKSADGGNTWNQLTSILPAGTTIQGDMIRLALAPSASGTVYASVFTKPLADGNLPTMYRTTDGGAHWSLLTQPPTQEWRSFHAVLNVDPHNAQTVYVNGDGTVYQSTDGGGTWTAIYGEDPVQVSFDKQGALVLVGDRGIYRWTGAGTAFANKQGNLQITEFYNIALDPHDPSTVFGISQDHFKSIKYTGTLGWAYTNTGQELGRILVDPSDSKTVYNYDVFGPGSGAITGAGQFFIRSDDGGATWTQKITGLDTSGYTDYFTDKSVQNAFAIDPINTHRLLVGDKQVFESTDRADHWAALPNSPALASGVVIQALAIARSQGSTVYAGTSDGKLFLTQNDGASVWMERDAGLPNYGVNTIRVDPANPLHAFVTLNFTGVWMTTDGGASWTNQTGDLGLDLRTETLAVDWRYSTPVLYVGTLRGVYRSLNQGTNWTPFGQGMPNTSVSDLEFAPGLDLLAAGTYGRGAFEITVVGPADPAQSTVTVTPTVIASGGSATVTLTARDSAGKQEASGGSSVQFTLGAGSAGGSFSGVVDHGDGTYTARFTPAASGSDTISAIIDGRLLTSNPAQLTVTAFTTTHVASNHNPAALGQSITFTATVLDVSGSAAPTGSVEFFDGSTDLGPGSAFSSNGSSATSTITISTLGLGNHAIKAVYTPTGFFTGGNGTLSQMVDAVTNSGVSSSINPSAAGQSITLTATITNSSGSGGAPTGTVEFFNGSTDLGAGTALSGNGNSATSTLTISTLPVGADAIQAVYTPSGNFIGSNASATQTVDAVAGVGVISNNNPAALGQSITFTATVTNTTGSGGTPTGAVEFFDGSTDLGPGSALGGSGNSATSTLTISTLPLGNHAIQAVYTAAGDFTGGQGGLTQKVGAVTSDGVVSNNNPSAAGQSVTLTATITNSSGAGGPPTGSVEFFNGATDLGAGTALSANGNSAASTLTISTLPVGVDAIQAVYTPSGNFLGSNGSTTQTVDAVVSVGAASNNNPSSFGQAVTFTATVTNTTGSGGTPTGAVEFFNGATDLGPGSALTGVGNAATSTLTISTLAVGVSTIKAVYTPTGAFTGGNGSTTQNVNAVVGVGVGSNNNPSLPGQSITFTATVTNTSGSGGTPTGSVEFFDGAVDLGAGSGLSGAGNAATSTFTISTLSKGAHSIRAVYTPTGNFLGGNGAVNQTVGLITSTGVTSNLSPAAVGQFLTFTATVTNTTNGNTPTGTVEFFDGATDLGAGSTLTGAGASAVSTFAASTLPIGSDAIQAVYTPTGAFVGGGGMTTQVVTALFPAPPPVVVSAVLKTNGELDLFNQQSGAVTVISPAGTIASITTALNPAGQTVVFATVTGADAFGDLHTLWQYNPASPSAPWSEISTGSFTQIRGANSASGVPLVLGLVADSSLWEHNPANGSGLNQGWTELSSGSFLSISPVSTANGVIVYGLVSGGTLLEQNPANGTGLNVGWTELSNGSFQAISGGVNGAGQTVVYGLVSGGTLWEQNPANGSGLNVGWTQLSGGPPSFLSVASGGADTAFAVASDHTLWQHGNAGWTQLSVGHFAQISATESATGADLVFAALSDGEFWDYNSGLLPGNPWTQAMQNGSPLAGAALSSTPS
jgi:hypothetical protein